MSYALRITTLLESIRLLDDKIAILNENKDKNILKYLIDRRNVLYNEVCKYNKIQWKEEHEHRNKQGL